jgi:hypothetical protein
MKRQSREELERIVQSLERRDPKASSRTLEAALAEQAPVAHGEWAEETPELRSRLRAVQRWRSGARGREAGKALVHLFPYAWPVGDRQRQELDPGWEVPTRPSNGSWRLYLYNCAPEVLRDVRVLLDGQEIDYSPSILMGRFAEVHWQRVEAVRGASFDGPGSAASEHELEAMFVIAKGTRQARVAGRITIEPGQGWTFFASRDGRRREIE